MDINDPDDDSRERRCLTWSIVGAVKAEVRGGMVEPCLRAGSRDEMTLELGIRLGAERRMDAMVCFMLLCEIQFQLY